MEDWMVLGLAAGLLTTVGFVPQLVKGYQTKRMDDVSLVMPMLLSAGMALWLGYGLMIDSFPIIFWNIVALILNLGMIVLKLKLSRSVIIGTSNRNHSNH
jgi:MtN3 and saliva related transmembrane protein